MQTKCIIRILVALLMPFLLSPPVFCEEGAQDVEEQISPPALEKPLSKIIEDIKNPDQDIRKEALSVALEEGVLWDAQHHRLRDGIKESEVKELVQLVIQLDQNSKEPVGYALMLTALGPYAIEALPSILNFLKSEVQKMTQRGETADYGVGIIAMEITRMGPDVIPLVTEEFNKSDGQSREIFQEILQKIQTDQSQEKIKNVFGEQQKSISDLAQLLKDPDPEIRVETANILADRWQDVQPSEMRDIIYALADMLRDNNEKVRRAAVNAIYWTTDSSSLQSGLTEKDYVANKAIPVFIELLQDPDERVWREAGTVLYRIKAGFALTEALKGADDEMRARIEEILGDIESYDQSIVLSDGSEDLSKGVSPRVEVKNFPALIRELKDKDFNVRERAALTFAKLSAFSMTKENTVIAIPALIQALSDEDKKVRERAIVALGLFGFSAKHAIYPIILSMADSGETAVYYARNALVRIASPQIAPGYAGFPEITAELKQKAPTVDEAIAILTALLDNKDKGYESQITFLLEVLSRSKD